MTLQDCYSEIGADYKGFCLFLGNESIAKRIALKFPNDETYPSFCRAIKEENYEEAFRMAHSLKGIAANLYLTNLKDISSQVTETLRAKKEKPADELLQKLSDVYNKIISSMKEVTEQ